LICLRGSSGRLLGLIAGFLLLEQNAVLLLGPECEISWCRARFLGCVPCSSGKIRNPTLLPRPRLGQRRIRARRPGRRGAPAGSSSPTSEPHRGASTTVRTAPSPALPFSEKKKLKDLTWALLFPIVLWADSTAPHPQRGEAWPLPPASRQAGMKKGRAGRENWEGRSCGAGGGTVVCLGSVIREGLS
jgi:hypothetical protein